MTDEGLTTGVLNALNKQRNRTVCRSCGFPVPVYPGRYPTKCPHCDTGRDSKGVYGVEKATDQSGAD